MIAEGYDMHLYCVECNVSDESKKTPSHCWNHFTSTRTTQYAARNQYETEKAAKRDGWRFLKVPRRDVLCGGCWEHKRRKP